MIEVTKVSGGFVAKATPPHVNESWQSEAPMSGKLLIAELRLRGAHQTDIGDALYRADPKWLENSN
jgi:hypothetical protein